MKDCESAAITFCIVAIVAIFAGGCLYGCKLQNDPYYALGDKCIKAGGSWVPEAGGLCIAPRQQ